ncbi:MAG: hypothetical protein JEY71_16000 [Sphaerochaeta sp.]|nr:hypothetical protein [Sphaerochaeta sp.]
MKRMEIQIKKKDGRIFSDLKVEFQAGGKVAIVNDLSVSVEVGDSVLTKKANGQIVSQKVDKSFIDEMMGSMDFFNATETSVKARVLFLHGYEK